VSERLSSLQRSAAWFTIVGATAALVHYIVAVSLEASTLALPAWANFIGFLCAFPVSYFGHRAFSFVAQKSTHSHALPRFLMIACGGFFANQTLLLSILHLTALPFWLALGIVMVLVAVSTYILSRYWAFKAP
jgi:putative flippase GtrA